MLYDVVALNDIVAFDRRRIIPFELIRVFFSLHEGPGLINANAFDYVPRTPCIYYIHTIIYITAIMRCAGCYRDRLSTLIISRCSSKGRPYRKSELSVEENIQNILELGDEFLPLIFFQQFEFLLLCFLSKS